MLAVIVPDPLPSRAEPELDGVAIGRAARGEAVAAREFFECYHRQVHAFLWRMLSPHSSRALVEDLTQDTFLRAFKALPRFAPDGVARPSSWLLTIATRVALNELRRQRRRPDPTVDVELIAIPGGSRPDEGVQRKALGALIARAVAALPADQRAVLLLREYHDRSLDEIARAIGVPIGTVQSRLARARAALRSALEGAP